MELYSNRGSKVSLAKWTLATIEFPDKIPFLDMTDAPEDWNLHPVSTSRRDLGSTWARIPLNAYPFEHNILLNPLHPDFPKKDKLVSETKISFAKD